MKNIFVTGIGTDVGKTVISAIMVEAFKADYWKPVQSGCYYGTDSENVKKLISNTESTIHTEAYCLKQHMSPHAAAELEGVTIEMNKILLPKTERNLIIEGAGGIMVPLNRKEFIVDLIKTFNAEVILVIQNYLGSINHTLLSIDGLKFRNIKLSGIIFNGPPHQLSEEIICDYAKVDKIARVGKENEINPEVILRYVPAFQETFARVMS